uniref:Uncharacterized protein n=2 Tax=Rhodnius prolixus TaxID=13249 RepID=T1HWJ2_RHOPR
MFPGLDIMLEDNKKALNSLHKSLQIMAARTTATTVYRSWDSQLRLDILKKKKSEMPLDTIVDCLADTIKYDITMLDDILQCKFRPGVDRSACNIARIERETRAYLKFNGVEMIDQHDGLLESAIILLLERQAEELMSREQENSSRPKKVVVEYVENSALINVTSKASHPRSLLKTNQSVL